MGQKTKMWCDKCGALTKPAWASLDVTGNPFPGGPSLSERFDLCTDCYRKLHKALNDLLPWQRKRELQRLHNEDDDQSLSPE